VKNKLLFNSILVAIPFLITNCKNSNNEASNSSSSQIAKQNQEATQTPAVPEKVTTPTSQIKKGKVKFYLISQNHSNFGMNNNETEYTHNYSIYLENFRDEDDVWEQIRSYAKSLKRAVHEGGQTEVFFFNNKEQTPKLTFGDSFNVNESYVAAWTYTNGSNGKSDSFVLEKFPKY
jgi:hypothetical protein